MAADRLTEDGDTADPSAQWGSLCERFHEIRLGAYRHELVEAWRQVTQADPGTAGGLADWQRLDEQISLLDEQELDYAVRNAPIVDETAAVDDGWDDWGDEYICPVGKCDRRQPSDPGNTPRCELFRRDMTRLRARPDV